MTCKDIPDPSKIRGSACPKCGRAKGHQPDCPMQNKQYAKSWWSGYYCGGMGRGIIGHLRTRSDAFWDGLETRLKEDFSFREHDKRRRLRDRVAEQED